MISVFVTPLFYVLAMGVLLGGFIDGRPRQLEGATSYLAFVVPGLVAAHAMQIAVGETTYPVMGVIKWQRTFYAKLATPLAARDLVTRTWSSCIFRRRVRVRGLHAGAGAVRRLRVLVGADPRLRSSQVLVGMAFAALVFASACGSSPRRASACSSGSA